MTELDKLNERMFKSIAYLKKNLRIKQTIIDSDKAPEEIQSVSFTKKLFKFELFIKKRGLTHLETIYADYYWEKTHTEALLNQIKPVTT